MKHVIFSFVCFITSISFAQQIQDVDFKTAKANIEVNTNQKQVFGTITYTLNILNAVDSIYLDAQDFKAIEVQMEAGIYTSYYNKKQIVIKHAFKKGKAYQVAIRFSTYPKKALYFIDWDASAVTNSAIKSDFKKQVWTQGQGKYTSNWLPSIDDMNEKLVFNMSITFNKNYKVISNGKLIKKDTTNTDITWHYNMQHPIPSYLVALAIGKYHKKTTNSKNGIPLEMYYYPEDSLKFEPTYRYTKRIFDFLEEEIGTPYPWQNYKMVPVKDFLYAGMENTSLNIYSDAFVVDSTAFVDKNFVNINAHELAHQWFGDLVTAKSGNHHWLQEGFATYYALLAEKEIFGDDYYYWRLYEYAEELQAQEQAGQSTSLLNPKSSSATFYKKGCWVLHILREKVGDTAFKRAVKNYLDIHKFKNVETNDFIFEVQRSSGQDLNEFVDKWLTSSNFNFKDLEPYFFANKIQSNSGGKHAYYPLDCSGYEEICKVFLLENTDSFRNARIIAQLGNHISKSTFFTTDIKARQAIAKTLTEIPETLKSDYETLLSDGSYLTQEIALFNLWRNFPRDRDKYLIATKHCVGFNTKNIRLLWLTLALLTESYEPEHKAKYFAELVNYTSPNYSFEVRQGAFQYLNNIRACNDTCKTNLQQATTHHNWQFKNFAKSVLKEME